MFLKKKTGCFLLNHKHTYNYFLRQKDWGISLPYDRVKNIKKTKNIMLNQPFNQ